MRSVCIAALLAVAAVFGGAEDFEYKVGFYNENLVVLFDGLTDTHISVQIILTINVKFSI